LGVGDLRLRLQAHFIAYLHANEERVNFNERDPVRFCIDAGFAMVRTELDLNAGPGALMPWKTLVLRIGSARWETVDGVEEVSVCKRFWLPLTAFFAARWPRTVICRAR
jgi:hypothetical protein